ncbi:MAG: hypothetical protein WA116_04835 [Anaerolineaceae bacterium]
MTLPRSGSDCCCSGYLAPSQLPHIGKAYSGVDTTGIYRQGVLERQHEM